MLYNTAIYNLNSSCSRNYFQIMYRITSHLQKLIQKISIKYLESIKMKNQIQ